MNIGFMWDVAFMSKGKCGNRFAMMVATKMNGIIFDDDVRSSLGEKISYIPDDIVVVLWGNLLQNLIKRTMEATVEVSFKEQ